MYMKCVICDNNLTGRQKKYCSSKCSGKSENKKYQNYVAQRARGLDRKLSLIALKGGKCKCDYDENIAALTFHHRDPKQKKFGLDMHSLSNRSWESILEEAEKCDLLCANCHIDVHHPMDRRVFNPHKVEVDGSNPSRAT